MANDKNPVGQPTKMTKATVKLLEEIFELGGTDIEACKHAGISKKTLYNYQKKNPEYVHRKEGLKNSPTLKARIIINKQLDDSNVDIAKWYLERKCKDEFSLKSTVENKYPGGNPQDKPTAVLERIADILDTSDKKSLDNDK
jgi:hypothetical protein